MSEKLHFPRPNRLLVIGLIVSCLAISIPAIFSYRAQHQLADAFQWVAHTIEVQSQLQRLRSILLEAESNQRGFLLGSHLPNLEAYQSALNQIPPQLAQVRTLTADNATQQENLRQLDPLVAAKLDFMAQAISLQQHDQHAAAQALVATDRGMQTMGAIRSQLELMEQEESRLLVTREEYLTSRARFSTGFLFALVGLNLVFTLGLLLMFRRLTRAQSLITVCAWSHTVEYQGEWISFEEYLLRRFNLNTSHGISPAEMQKALADVPI